LSARVDSFAPSNTPPGQRSNVVGRSRSAPRIPSPTDRKYRTTSDLVIPSSGKYGLSGLDTRTDRGPSGPATSNSIAFVATAPAYGLR
jgi:hypothetical protein